MTSGSVGSSKAEVFLISLVWPRLHPCLLVEWEKMGVIVLPSCFSPTYHLGKNRPGLVSQVVSVAVVIATSDSDRTTSSVLLVLTGEL